MPFATQKAGTPETGLQLSCPGPWHTAPPPPRTVQTAMCSSGGLAQAARALSPEITGISTIKSTLLPFF